MRENMKTIFTLLVAVAAVVVVNEVTEEAKQATDLDAELAQCNEDLLLTKERNALLEKVNKELSECDPNDQLAKDRIEDLFTALVLSGRCIDQMDADQLRKKWKMSE